MISVIYFIRHGLTEGNIKHWFYGSVDVPLLPEGIDQLKRLRAEGIYPDIPEGSPVFTSALVRTEQTLQTIFGDLPHRRLPEFNEFDFGRYEKAVFEEMKDDPEFMAGVNDEVGNLRFGGGDSRDSFRDRVARGLDILRQAHASHEKECQDEGLPRAVSLAVIHGGVISQVMRQLFPAENRDRYAWIPDPGMGYAVYFEGGEPARHELIGRQGTMNATGHMKNL